VTHGESAGQGNNGGGSLVGRGNERAVGSPVAEAFRGGGGASGGR
jgi:hypothetical protein